MTEEKQKTMELSKEMLWDCDIEKMDLEASKAFIIKRAYTCGTLHDCMEVFDYYGRENVINALLNARSLDNKTLHYVSLIFEIGKEKFRCFKKTPSNNIFGMF